MDKAIETRALEIWREREAEFPIRCRRMNPDALDIASGAWVSCVLKAMAEDHINSLMRRED